MTTSADRPKLRKRDRLAPSRLLRRDFLRVGSVGLRSRRIRAALSALGIAIGIASMGAVLGISESSRADLLHQLDQLGTNLLTIRAGGGLGFGDGKLPESAEQMVSRIGAVQSVSAVGNVDARALRSDLVDPNQSGGVVVRAARTGLLQTTGGRVAQGRFLDAASSRYPTVVLGAVAAQRLGITTLHPGTAISIGGQRFSVIGILSPVPLSAETDRSVMIGFDIAKQLFGFDGRATTIYTRADTDSVAAVRRVLPATVNPEHPDEVDTNRPSDALAARAAAKGAFRSLFLGLGAVALLVGGVGIANVMVISVLERRSEIGLRRAIGATRRHVSLQFLTESLLLAALGGVAGVAIGAAATTGYALSRQWRVVVPVQGLAMGVGAALLIGALAGLYPAVRASRLSPTEALRTV
ncbi:MAG: ABC transporter permease [Actinomycetota bacterium]